MSQLRLLPVLALALAAACSDSTGSGSGESRVRLNLAAKSQGTAASLAVTAAPGTALLQAPVTYTDGSGNTLVLDQVQLVLREIELKRLSDDACTVASGSSDDDDCEEVSLGIRLYDVPLGAAAAQSVYTVAVEPGTYREIEFEIHKPEDDGSDAAFVAANPNFAGVSIRATGSYNGTPFTFTSDLSEEIEIEFATPVVVGAEGTTDVTLNIDVSNWFRTGAGVLLSPSSANKGQPNEGLVKERIRNTFESFEDDDRDGEDD